MVQSAKSSSTHRGDAPGAAMAPKGKSERDPVSTTGAEALAEQVQEVNEASGHPADRAILAEREAKRNAVGPKVEREKSNRENRAEAHDDVRKAHAKKTGGNLFPEKRPENDQIVLATKSSRNGSPMFMAQYHKTDPNSPFGAFYSNLSGSYSVFEGAVDSWTKLPGE